ncbi:MAG: SpoIIE family protein phosphatase [Victivallales bacterium]|nr:SpoIIE family protein phosphatase [Victivallales bacterium]
MNRRYFLLIVAIILYVATLSFTWLASTRRAVQQTESMLDYAMLDLRDTLKGAIDTMMMHVAESIVNEIGTASSISVERAKSLIKLHGIDELNIFDRTGRNLGSSDSRLVGTSIKDNPKSSEFLTLVESDSYVIAQPFRAGVHNPDARRKYLGIALPDKSGIVQVGIDESHVTRMFPFIMGFIFDEWLLGEHGFFLCASTADGQLISNPARHRDEARFLSETGYNPKDPSVIENGKTTFRQTLFGDICDCRAVIFADYRIIAALPPTEYYTTRTIYFTATAIALAIVLSCFALLLWRIDKDSARIEAFYAAEENKRTAELELGKTIQLATLPTEFPNSEYFSVAAAMVPAREVGGDFYDIFAIDDTHIAFLAADVSGKGITGALYMMTAKTLIKDTLLASDANSPAAALTSVNAELCRNNPAEMFITAWVGVLDIDTGTVLFANAGHNPPILRHASGKVEWLRQRSGCPLACFETAVYKQIEISLSPEDALFLYTDGVTEAMNDSGELFGNDRLFDTLQAMLPPAPQDGKPTKNFPSQICHEVRTAVEHFAAGAPQADDITVLSIQYISSTERYLRTFPVTEDALNSAAAFVESHLDSSNCSPKAKSQLLIALDEIISNIIRCSNASGISLSLRLTHAPDGVIISISDDGRPFNPLKVPSPDTSLSLQDRPIGGLGILLLRKTMDNLFYRYARGCNILTIHKNF